MDGLERIFPVLFVVARGDVRFLAADVWRDHPLISGLLLRFPKKLLQTLPDSRPPGEPEWKPCAHFLGKREQFQLFPQFPVIALFGFFEETQVLIQFALLGKTDWKSTRL